MFGIGAQEIIVLLILGVGLLGVPAVVVILLIVMRGRQGGEAGGRDDRVAELEAENRRLRQRLGEGGGEAGRKEDA